MRKLILCCLLLPMIASAKDFGTWGDVYPVAEQSFLNMVKTKLDGLEQDGQMQKFQEEAKKRIISHVLRPNPVSGITPATKYTVKQWNPSIVLNKNLENQNGEVFAWKGEKINPLNYIPFNETLYFINADDPAQIEWLKEQEKIANTPIQKVILVEGDIQTTSDTLNQQIFFDQKGKITQKLGIKTVPTKVTPNGETLKIESFAVDEGNE